MKPAAVPSVIRGKFNPAISNVLGELEVMPLIHCDIEIEAIVVASLYITASAFFDMNGVPPVSQDNPVNEPVVVRPEPARASLLAQTRKQGGGQSPIPD